MTLEVDRVAMAKSGSLLLLVQGSARHLGSHAKGAAGRLPRRAGEADHHRALHAAEMLPGGASDGFDSSRKDSEYRLDPRAFADVNAACARWTHRLAGAQGQGEPGVARAGGAVLVRGRPAVVLPPVMDGHGAVANITFSTTNFLDRAVRVTTIQVLRTVHPRRAVGDVFVVRR